MKTVLIWDIENISYRFKNEILNIVPENTVKYIVSKQKITAKKIKKFTEDGFIIFSADFHETADLKIESIMKIISLNTSELFIVSSDTDFVSSSIKVKSLINKIHFVMDDNNKRGILMHANLTDRQNCFHIIGSKKIKKIMNQKPFQKWSEKDKKEIEHKREERKKLKNKILIHLGDKNILNVSIEKKEKVKIDGKTYFFTFNEWIDKQVERLTEKRINDYSNIGTCSICHKENIALKSANCYDSMFCQECEKEWVHYQKTFKSYLKKDYNSISHHDRFLKFFEIMDFEYKINEKINYQNNIIDLLQMEINQITMPACYLSEEEETNTIYKEEFSNNPFEILKKIV